MGMAATDIKKLILEAFPDAELELQDLAGDNDHYAITIISAHFKHKTRIEQHRLVHQALQGKMGTQLHALSIRTAIPKE